MLIDTVSGNARSSRSVRIGLWQRVWKSGPLLTREECLRLSKIREYYTTRTHAKYYVAERSVLINYTFALFKDLRCIPIQ